MNTTPRRIALACLAISLAACGTRYEVYTCAFGSADTTCTPVRTSESPKDFFDMHFTLVNPGSQVLVCSGEFHLGVNAPKSGYVSWHAQEQDETTCAVVGPEMTGEERLTGDVQQVDAHFPQGDFTFRVVLRPEGE